MINITQNRYWSACKTVIINYNFEKYLRRLMMIQGITSHNFFFKHHVIKQNQFWTESVGKDKDIGTMLFHIGSIDVSCIFFRFIYLAMFVACPSISIIWGSRQGETAEKNYQSYLRDHRDNCKQPRRKAGRSNLWDPRSLCKYRNLTYKFCQFLFRVSVGM